MFQRCSADRSNLSAREFHELITACIHACDGARGAWSTSNKAPASRPYPLSGTKPQGPFPLPGGGSFNVLPLPSFVATPALPYFRATIYRDQCGSRRRPRSPMSEQQSLRAALREPAGWQCRYLRHDRRAAKRMPRKTKETARSTRMWGALPPHGLGWLTLRARSIRFSRSVSLPGGEGVFWQVEEISEGPADESTTWNALENLDSLPYFVS